jgi:aspartate racemase
MKTIGILGGILGGMSAARRLADRGADCLIPGCTEVGMLLDQGSVPVPVFDTTMVHGDAALDLAFEQ